MDLAAFIDIPEDAAARRRRLAQERSYAIADHVDALTDRVNRTLATGSYSGAVAPEIFVGSGGYPTVATGVVTPVDPDLPVDAYRTDRRWYSAGLQIADVFDRRAVSVHSHQRHPVTDVAETWDGVIGTQREVAIADRPVSVDLAFRGRPQLSVDADGIATPVGPRAPVATAELTENPHVPRPVAKVLEDDEWHAGGAMRYLYRRGYDVYAIESILAAGALGTAATRRLVPTRWSITATDDAVGGLLRGQIRNHPSVDATEVYHASHLGNAFWVILTPGSWEYELVELQAPGSIWNPTATAVHIGSDHEGVDGRSGYVTETAGAYHAARLGVLEALADRGRTATALIIRHISDDYYAPVGVWLVRETVRDALDGSAAPAESFDAALDAVCAQLPVDRPRLQRVSTVAAGRQQSLSAFG
jgi:Uncharacterized conserved protein